MIDKQIKFKINRVDELLNKFREIEAIFIDGTFEKTTLFDTENNDLQKNGLFLRTRDGYENTLTLKEKDTSQGEFFERIKTMVEIESIENINYILNKIGFLNQKIMEKYRLTWKINNINVTIDELPFGVFLEIHGDDLEINEVCSLIGLKKCDMINKTYWDLHDQESIDSKKNKNIKFNKEHVFLLGSFID